jgi:GNAT superfamily N-acetyltransferase
MVDISNLRNEPHFAATIADRGWNAWGSSLNVTLAEYLAGVEEMTRGDGVPYAFVAHSGLQYIGSVLLIENDLESRPAYAPWIAALWVEPAFRRQGVAVELLETARSESLRLGHANCYLCAKPSKTPYYLARGFRLIERDVGDVNILKI